MISYRKSFLGFVLLALASASNSSICHAGRVDQLYDHASMGSPLLSLIQSAKHTLDIEIYQMGDSDILSAVKSAVRQNVKVRVIEEANTVASACHVFDPVDASDTASCVTQKQLVPYVRNHGGSYVAFNADLCGTPGGHCYQHGKMLIADGNLLLVSTGNFNASTLCDKKDGPSTCNRDYSLLTRDPLLTGALQGIFNHDLLGKAYDVQAIVEKVGEQRLSVSPFSLKPLVDFINSAKISIQLENQYLKDPEMNQALMAAAKRGVKVFAMVSSICSYGQPKEPKDHAAITNWNQNFADFDHAGIHSRIFTEQMPINGMPGYLHAKVILVDGVRAWVGSVNGSSMSLSQNREFGIFTSESQAVQLLRHLLYADFTHPRSESWQESLICKKDYGRASPSEDPPSEDPPSN